MLPERLKPGDLVGLLDLLPDDSLVAVTDSHEVVALSNPLREEGAASGSKPIRLRLGGRAVAGLERAAIGRTAEAVGTEQMKLHI